jgi:hypothetical protein
MGRTGEVRTMQRWVGILRRRAAAVALFSLVMVAGTGAVATSAAPAPPPALDACLTQAPIDIASDPCQWYHPPSYGNQFGTVPGNEIHHVARGATVTLNFPGGAAIDFVNPTRPCGDQACPYNRIYWRAEDGFIHNGDWFEYPDPETCKDTSITCKVRFLPRWFGDSAEVWVVMWGQLYDGIYPQNSGKAYAFYSAPILYPVRLDPVNAAGAAVAAPEGTAAYAVRRGLTTSPKQADCVAEDWYLAHTSAVSITPPACVTLRRSGYYSGESWYEGVLPNSTAWDVVAAPVGDPARPLLQRPARFRVKANLVVNGNDIEDRVVEATRPDVDVEVIPQKAAMDLNSVQQVTVRVRSTGGVAGSLSGLKFESKDVIGISEDAAVRVLQPVPTFPAAGFTLATAEVKTFTLTVRAVGIGTSSLDVRVTGTDDLGESVEDRDAEKVSVAWKPPPPPPPGSSIDSIKPPVIDYAVDVGPKTWSNPDSVQGRVEGKPGSRVIVSLVASAAQTTGARCSQRMSGPGVKVIGSVAVDIGQYGRGYFYKSTDVTTGWYVYGVTTDGSLYSKVGDCTPVAPLAVILRPYDTRRTEGTDAGETILRWYIRRDGTIPTGQTARVDYAITTGTPSGVIGAATTPADYTRIAPFTGTLIFGPDDYSKEIQVRIVRDRHVEPDERFFLTLSNPVNAKLMPRDGTEWDDQGVGTIVDDDPPTVRIGDVSVPEGTGTGTTPARLTLTLSARSGMTVSVRFGTANGTAVQPGDYVAVAPSAASSLVTFAPGQTTRTIALQVRKDALKEPAERFLVNLSAPVNARLVAPNGSVNDAQGVVTIANDD